MKEFPRALLFCFLAELPLHAGPKPAKPVPYTATPFTEDGGVAAGGYPQFAAAAATSVVVPGLEEGLVPQGLSWLPQRNWFVFSGYRSDKAAGALVAVDAESGEIKGQVRLQNPDGTAYTGHAGGVAATAGSLVVSSDGTLHSLPISDFPEGADGADCTFAREIVVPNRASYCFCGDGVFWVGEFHHPGYRTDKGHRMKFGGEEFQAWLCGYRLRDGELPLDDSGELPPPDYILETPDDVQGASISDGIVWLSRSYGRDWDSTLEAFAASFGDAPDGTFKVGDADVPAWFLGRNRRLASAKAPPMSENLCRVGDGVCVVFESGAKVKRGGKCPVDRVFRFPNAPDWCESKKPAPAGGADAGL